MCLALASASLGRPVAPDVMAIGEVALSGDIRPVPFLAQRISEAARLGFGRVLVPRGSLSRLPKNEVGTSPRLTEVAHLEDALGMLRHLAAVPD